MKRSLLGLVVGAFLAAMVGCGGEGNGPEGGAPPAGETVPMGPLDVGVDSAAALKTVTLSSPGASRIAFAALYGTRIVRLRELGFGRIVFDSNRHNDYDVFVMNADGTQPLALTSSVALDGSGSWSPDGKRIAFRTNRTGNYEIYVMNADGTGPTNLTSSVADDISPAWSPDGKRIAFRSNRTGNYEIYVMNADGSGQTNLTNNPDGDFSPCWSPDGRRIAFHTFRDGNYEIYVMNADGTVQANLTNNASQDYAPAWSPDGKKIAFYTSRTGNDEIYVMNRDGSGQTNLTNHAAGDSYPSWSPDGRRILFTSNRDGNNEIYVMNANGSDQTNLTAHEDSDQEAAWCPAPSVVRSLIGANSSDGGKNPPFGGRRPLAVVGLNANGLASATTIGMDEANWGTLGVVPLTDIGIELAGAKITGAAIQSVIEDMGRGIPTRTWAVSASPATRAVLVFWSGETGKVTSVIASSDTALGSEDAAKLAGGRVVVTGNFAQVRSAEAPERNLAASPATRVELDGRTGEVVRVQ
jgi:TolB protein